MSLASGTRLGPYEITAPLGAGGMGEVYRARDTKLGRDVALKILPVAFASDPERLARFEREARNLAALNHPNIAAIYGVEDRALVMELVDGEDLSTRIARGPVALDEALVIARQIAEALEAAHERGIVHRDLKPANVKIRGDGTVKVLDFGLAKAVEPSVASGIDPMLSPTITSPATQLGTILGTAAYMAPEQARGMAVDRRADIWAFGCILYEMLTRRRPFAGDDVSMTLAAILKESVDFDALPAGTPSSLQRLLRRCLAKDRKDRLADMSDARLDIRDALSGEAAPTNTPPPVNRRWQYASAALAVVSVVLAAVLARTALAPPRDRVVPDVMQFALLDDSNMQVSFTSQAFAISPDGKTVVFHGSLGAASGLWVRTLDQSKPRLLAGTEGAINAAISPDAQWVAFVVANHIIRKVRLSGGAPVSITSIDDVTASLAWESNDRLLFEKIGSSSGIHRISANGGEPQLLIPLASGEQMQRIPVVLREPGLVFYSARSKDWRESLSVFSLKDGRRNRLDVDGFRALGLIDDHLVYARSDGAVMAVPFDAKSLRAIGEPRQLEPRVAPQQFGPSVALSESGTLVSLPSRSQLSRIVLADLEGRVASLGDARAFELPRFSPDGQRVAVGIADRDAVDLWVLDRGSAEAIRVTRGGLGLFKLEAAAGLGWMRDGASLVYIRNGELWTTSVDGSAEPRRLVAVEGAVQAASVHPDGRSIVAIRRVTPDATGLYREELVRVPLAAGEAVTPILASLRSGVLMRPTDPRVSPDGNWVAFFERNEIQIHVRSIDGATGVQVSDAGGTQPVWGADSRTLHYETTAGPMVAELQTSPSLAVLRRRRLPNLPTAGRVQDVSPDGKTLLVLVPVDPAPKVLVTVNWSANVGQQLRAAGPR